MIEIIPLLQGIIERGLILSSTVAAVYIASGIIKFDNLAIEGAFGLGGACAALLLQAHVNPWLTLVGAALVGGISGIMTGMLNTRLALNNLISGIVITTATFSIILTTAGSTLMISGTQTIFTAFSGMFACYQPLLILTLLSCILFYVFSWLLTTEVGFLLYAVGENPQMLTNIGKSVHRYKIVGLTISNTLAALSGALFVHYTGYFSMWAQVGVLLIGLTGMIIAQTFGTYTSCALIMGSILYQAIIALTFELQFDPAWNKLITALLIVLVIVIKQQWKQ